MIGIFMILFGTNFNLYYFLLLGNFSKVFKKLEGISANEYRNSRI